MEMRNIRLSPGVCAPYLIGSRVLQGDSKKWVPYDPNWEGEIRGWEFKGKKGIWFADELWDLLTSFGQEVFDGPHTFSGKLGLPFLRKHLSA